MVFGIICGTKTDLIKNMWVSDDISCSSNFALYLEDYSIEECHT